MPKNTVSDPITDQEMAFAHLVLIGTMNDRRAAEAVGLNPDSAAYTKAKPRVRAYLIEHRAAVRERLVDQEAEGLRQLNLGRDQILARLWELANLSPEATRGSMAGQVKALSMIVAIEGLIPSGTMNDRRLSPSGSQPATPPVEPQMYRSQWRSQQPQTAGEEPGDPVAAAEAQPAAPQAPDPEPPPPLHRNPQRNFDRNLDPNQPSLANPFVIPQPPNRVPAATDLVFDAVLNAAGSPGLPFYPQKGSFARPR
jgi:hypothetical protein